MKNKTKSAFFFGLFLLVSVLIKTSYAQENYQFELAPEYRASEDDDDVKTTIYAVTGRFYFSPVNIGSHPYAEAAFLERVGNVGLILGQTKLDFGDGIEGDGPAYGAELVFMQPGSPIFIEANYVRSEFSSDAPLDVESEGDVYSLQLGGFVTQGLRVNLGYAHQEVNVTSLLAGIDDTTEFDAYAVIAKFVKELSGGTAVNVEGFFEINRFDDGIDDGSNTEAHIAADYYFTQGLSAGIGFTANQGDDEGDEGKTFLVRLNAFITPRFSINASFEQFSADNDAGLDEDTFLLGLLLRI
jgi:hypothetical protein